MAVDNINIKEFETWMHIHTNLAESSILLYVRTAKDYIDWSNNDFSIENINAFVSTGFRESRSYYKKYLFKYLLKFLKFPENDKGVPELYTKIVTVRIRPRAKMRKHMPEYSVHTLINNIEDELYQDIAKLQYAIGCRARGILTLSEDRIEFNYIDPELEHPAIRMRLEEKRGKERTVFVDKTKYEIILRKYLTGSNKYLFMPGPANHADGKDLERMIDTIRKYYNNAIQKAAKLSGLHKMGSHDFRANFINDLLKQTNGNAYLVKNIVGHSDIRQTLRYADENPPDAKKTMLEFQNR